MDPMRGAAPASPKSGLSYACMARALSRERAGQTPPSAARGAHLAPFLGRRLRRLCACRTLSTPQRMLSRFRRLCLRLSCAVALRRALRLLQARVRPAQILPRPPAAAGPPLLLAVGAGGARSSGCSRGLPLTATPCLLHFRTSLLCPLTARRPTIQQRAGPLLAQTGCRVRRRHLPGPHAGRRRVPALALRCIFDPRRLLWREAPPAGAARPQRATLRQQHQWPRPLLQASVRHPTIGQAAAARCRALWAAHSQRPRHRHRWVAAEAGAPLPGRAHSVRRRVPGTAGGRRTCLGA
jgi:hypothetical protein